MWIILDILVIAIIIIYALISAKRGFVRTAIELVGFVLAVYLSFAVGGAVADGIYTYVVEPVIVDTIVDTVGETATNSVSSTIDAVWQGMPELITKTAGNLGVTSESVKNNITAEAFNTESFEEIALQVADSVARPVVVPLIKTIVGFILFVVLLLVVKLLARIINRAFSLPLIGGLNRSLGGILGAAKGVVIAAVVCILISTVVTLSKNGFLIFTQENIAQTTIFKFFADFSPIK